MGIIIDNNTRVLVQGITGKEGLRAAKEMVDYGTKVSCGVTPGKGGTEIDGFKVFDSIREAKEYDKLINTSVLFVPPIVVFDAAIEAMNNGIKTIVIVTENVPLKDSVRLFEYAQQNNCLLIGPSSIGVINLGVGKLGAIAGSKEDDMFRKGNVGVISKSGGMCSETSLILTQNGLGQSTVVGIGGEVIIGSTFTDILSLFEKDKDTKIVVIYGEIGGLYEEQIAQMIKEKKFTKPIVAFISGKFVESIPRNLSFGHAGAIIENNIGSAETKKKLLKEAGVLVADYHYQIPDLVKSKLFNEKFNQK